MKEENKDIFIEMLEQAFKIKYGELKFVFQNGKIVLVEETVKYKTA